MRPDQSEHYQPVAVIFAVTALGITHIRAADYRPGGKAVRHV